MEHRLLWTAEHMLSLLRPVALAIVCAVLLCGCAARKQFGSAPMPPKALTSRGAGPSAAAEATERVKDAIKSLGRQLKRRTAKSPRALADLEPIPLIRLSDRNRERAVGTSGIWSVVETTRAGADKPDLYAQSQTRSAESRRRGGGFTRWTLLTAGAAVLLAVIALGRLQSSKTRLEHL